MVFINIKNINKAGSSIKLDYRNIRLYKVKKMLLSLVYKLELLILMRI